MTLSETAKVITMMDLIYPDTNRDKTEEERKMKVTVWQRLFSKEPVQVVTAALESYMTTTTERFAPTPGQIKEHIRQLSEGSNDLTEGEAWSLVASALRRSAYYSEEEFAKLPECVQRCVGSPKQLQEWALMDAETVASVVASNFQRGFRYRKQQMDEKAKLPEATKHVVEELAQRMNMPMIEDHTQDKEKG